MAEDKNKTAAAEAAKAEEVTKLAKEVEAKAVQEAKEKADKVAAEQAKKAEDEAQAAADKLAADAKAKADQEAAKAEEAKAKSKPKKFTVKSEFRDKDNFDKIHKVGDDVSKFDASRLTDLVSRGLVNKS